MVNEPIGHPDPATLQKVFLETFGCQMNVLDSQLVRGQLEGLGYQFIEDWQKADIVLYNTCSVREHAEQKVWSRLGRIGVHRQKGGKLIVGVIGCMAEREGADMARRYPQVDFLCGPAQLDKVPMLIDNAVRTAPLRGNRRGEIQVALQGRRSSRKSVEDRLELLDLSRSFALRNTDSGGGSSYVRITRGCNKYCTYCVVPLTRGQEIHRPPSHIIHECQQLVERGIKEVTLLGQTVNHYHYDEASSISIDGVCQPQIGSIIGPNRGTGGSSPRFGRDVTSFADLLAQIHDAIPDLLRLRFVTSFPRDFGDDILKVMADRPRICRYLHLPVQSGSDRILKLMNRGYQVEDYKDLLRRVRQHLPDVEIATDVICGFPSETEEDHQATAKLLEFGRFKNAFVFKYSPRPATAAAERLPDDVSDKVKRQRNHDLLSIQSRVSAEVHRTYVGRTVTVLVEAVSAKARKALVRKGSPLPVPALPPGGSPMQLTGRTATDLIVCFDGDPSLVGEVAQVKVDASGPLVLFGHRTEAKVSSLEQASVCEDGGM